MKRSLFFKKGIPLVFISTIFLGTLFQNCSPVAFTNLSSEELNRQTCESNPSLCPNPPEGPTCSFNGNTYNEGESITAFLSSSVPAGQTCQSEERVCKNGSFTGSYSYATCSPGAYRSCLFNGVTLAHGHTVQAYLNSSVAFGATCQSENRTCNDGILSGTYVYSSCAPGAAGSCLFNGRTIAHGTSVTAYPASSVPFGQTCQAQTRTCNNGTLSGSAQFESCTPGGAASCLFNGTTVPHGGSVTAYQTSSVSYGQTCAAQTRTCNNGTLSGTYQYSTCSASSVASCLFNGQTIAHGQGITAYASSSVGYGQSCASQYRVCNNGSLGGSYQYPSCSAGSAANCNFNGQTVYHGQSVTAFANSSVPFGQVCSSENRTCNNGSLSGSYGSSSCSVAPAPTYASCTDWYGNVIPHGSGRTAFAASSVPYGQSCASEWRTCNNGTFTGSYGFPSCTVEPAPVYASCTVNGGDLRWGDGCSSYTGVVSIPHGGSHTFPAMVGWGDSQGSGSITASCNNGAVSTSGATCRPPNPGSPLMVHFNSNTEQVEPLEFSSQIDGIIFDILGLNSTPVPYAPKRISWYRSSQYFFIALPNEKGDVKGIDQLFGDNTHGPDGKFAKDGYKALAKYDGMSADGKKRLHPADGFITAKDAVFVNLRLWNDENYDGIAQTNELQSLESKNVEIIDLNADPNFKETDKYGNETTLKSVVKTKDGRYHLMFDVWFAYKNIKQ